MSKTSVAIGTSPSAVRLAASQHSTQVEIGFGNCTVSIARREIRLNGRVNAVAPKVFDLLIFLIERQHRVVRKRELLDAIWSGAVVSDSVVARTVMKARQAIGDSASDPKLLKTFHRVGYSFMADVAGRDGDSAAATTSRATDEPSTLRIAVLPFESGASDEALHRVVSGLSGLVAQALSADKRLSVVDSSAVAEAVSGLDAKVPRKLLTQNLMALVGAGCTVQAALKLSAGGFKLNYWIRGHCDLQGSIGGAEPTALGRRLAKLIESALFPGAIWPVPFESSDALANQAFARAIHVFQQQKWTECARLLKFVLDVEPTSTSAGLQYLRVLANMQDRASLEVGARLLERATRDADVRLLAATHEAMSLACFNIGGELASRSRSHLQQALEFAQSFHDEEWIVRLYLYKAITDQLACDYVQADAFYELAWQANLSVGNQLRRAFILGNRAALELSVGRPLVSIDYAEQARSICDRLPPSGRAMEVRAILSRARASLGLFARAAELDEINIDALAQSPAIESDAAAFAQLVIAENAFETRDPGPLGRAMERRGFAADVGKATAQATARVVDAHLAALQGRPAEMADCMRSALDAVRFGPEVEKTHQWTLDWLELSMRVDGTAEVRRVEARVEALSGCLEDDALQGALLRAKAARAHADGDSASARALLLEAIEVLPTGRFNALARIDAAWLLTEAGEQARAARILRDIGPWQMQHPIGLAASARLHHAFGRVVEGRAAIEACAELLEEKFPPAFERLRAALATGGDALESLPGIARLPTLC